MVPLERAGPFSGERLTYIADPERERFGSAAACGDAGRTTRGGKCVHKSLEVHTMKKNRWVLRLLALLALCGVLNVTALAVEAGSSGDPLVTLSYLNDTFLGTIMTQVDQKIAARNSQIAQQIGGQGSAGTAASSFVVVTLSNGQTLKGNIGCEVMLRVGTAVCVASSTPGLIDESAATTLNNGGALVQNHLYMMTIENRGVKATAATTKLLVRGSYTIG